MKYLNSIPYHKILELLESNNFKTKKKITIYSLYNFNALVLNQYLELYLKQKGFKPKILSSEFDQIDQELLSFNRNSKIKKSDIIIVGSDINTKLSYNEIIIDNYLNNLKNNLIQCLKKINKSKNSSVIFFNSTILNSTFFSSKDRFVVNSKKIFNFNENLHKLSQKYKNLKILDINAISNLTGMENFYDQKNYYLAKIPYSQQSNNHISFKLSQIIGSIFFARKKCLVLDLDNTLWGGILGEDGLGGIDLGKTYKGECFRNFQKYLKTLLKKGVILAICSKNNIEDVKECFKKNKEMVLNFKDFSNVQINWKEKYINVNKIAEELNIGKESIVFFDDSDFEREQMKKFNPLVNVLDTPKDPEYFIQTIENSSFFYQNTQTEEDKKKKYQYKILKQANELKSKVKDINEFLKNLSMTLEIIKINKFNFERCVQLTNKVNQFNLTTKRYSSSELQSFFKSTDQISLVARLKDKFGDHGITALVMAKKTSDKTWIIDTFLQSCRILGRGVENVLLYELLKKLKQKKINFVEGNYIKTKKNHQCKNFFTENDFIKKRNSYLYELSKLKKLKNNFLKIKYE